MKEIIMGYQGEMSLKGLNRNQFEAAMMKILRYRLKTVGKFKVYCTQSTFYMEPEEEDVDMDLAFERVSKVFGLAALSRAVVCEKDFDTICQTAEDYLGSALHGIRTFKVEARRADKTYPMTSPELMRELGAYLLGKHNYLKVDVHNPQFKVIVEIRDYGAYIHGPKIPGEGGLPVGTSGRALNMLSGGIDTALERLFGQERDQAVVQMNLNAKNYNLAAEPMSNVYGALYSTLATDDPNQRKSMRYIGSSIGRIFYLMDKAERFEADKCSGRYNVFVVNDLMGQASAVENARRQALAAANDLMRVYSMLDVKLNRSLLDNIMLLGLHHAVEPLEVGAEQENWEIP